MHWRESGAAVAIHADTVRRWSAACAELALTLGFFACGPAPTPAWHQEAGYRWRDVVVPRGDAGFTRMDAGTTGIHFQNFVSDSVLLHNRILGQGAGVAL